MQILIIEMESMFWRKLIGINPSVSPIAYNAKSWCCFYIYLLLLSTCLALFRHIFDLLSRIIHACWLHWRRSSTLSESILYSIMWFRCFQVLAHSLNHTHIVNENMKIKQFTLATILDSSFKSGILKYNQFF